MRFARNSARARLPLNIFEPRYLAMLDDVLRSDHRLIGMVQPFEGPAPQPKLHVIGCAGRVTSLSETEDGRYLIALTGVSRFLKEKNPQIQIIGAQPAEGSRIPGIRKWPEAYMPKIYDPKYIDRTEPVSQSDAEHMARRMAREEGIFCGISAAGALCVALRIAEEVENATIVFVVCDRGDRYLSTGVFPA